MKRSRQTLFLALLFLFLIQGVSAAAAPGTVQNGKAVTMTYKLFVEGTLIEESNAKEPFTYRHGLNQIVPGLERALTGLKAGGQRKVRVPSAEAYGPVNPQAFQEVPKEKFPSDVTLKKGVLLDARAPNGEQRLVKIADVKEKTVIVDFNHPLAGKDLDFDVTVLKIE